MSPAAAKTFKDQPFARRFDAMGDAAEQVFEQTYPLGWARYGLNRPPINLATVPPIVRYTPDYITSKGLVECQGFGRDQTYKMKQGKWEALLTWNLMFRTDLFVWDSFNRRYGFVRLSDLSDVLSSGRIPIRQFPEGTAYWAVVVDQLPVVEWLTHEDQDRGS